MATLFAIEKCKQCTKVEIVAKYANFDLKVVNEKDLSKKHPLGQCPVLETAEGTICGADTICRHIASGSALYGKSAFEHSQVEQWIEFTNEIYMAAMAWTTPVKEDIPACPVAIKKAKTDLRKCMATMNTILLNQTFLVGERVSLADILVAFSLYSAYTLVLDPGFRKEFHNLNRWFVTVMNQPIIKAAMGETVLCAKAPAIKTEAEKPAAAPAAEKPKEQPKKEKKQEKKEEAEDEEEEGAHEEKKAPNPLDLLPPSKFVMDTWKRLYSNEDTLTKAIPWFWENYDAEGFSLFFCKYKYELNMAQPFMVSNLVGGFIQRLDAVRKYGFGSLLIFGNNPYEIEGVFLFRGKAIPAEMLACDDSELYNWTPVDIHDEAQKKKVNAFLAWEGEFGNKLNFREGKIFK